MKAFNVYKNLKWLNELPTQQAEDLLRACSGSEIWAQRMTKMRPFNMLESLYDAVDENWFALSQAERIAAYSGLGRETQAASPPDTARGEVLMAKSGTALDEASGLYQKKFGFIFVVSTNEKIDSELLAICKARLRNSVETELSIAAAEHRKVIEIRLNRLLEK